jgi:DNA-binding IclR family transcriptional regulator
MPILGALAPYLAQLREVVGGTVEVQALVRSAVVAIDRVDGPEAGLYREPHVVTEPLTTAAGRLLVARGGDEAWAAALGAADEALAAEAGRERDRWRAASWLHTAGTEAGAPGQVAVPLVDAHGTAVAALSANVPAGAPAERIEAIAGHLVRTGAAAVRTLGHA